MSPPASQADGRSPTRGTLRWRPLPAAVLNLPQMGAERCVLIKDEKGLYTADPKKDPSAKFIEEIDLGELLAMDLNDLAVERSMLESLQTARSVREEFIVNGLVPGNITQVLNGKNVGTRIYVKA